VRFVTHYFRMLLALILVAPLGLQSNVFADKDDCGNVLSSLFHADGKAWHETKDGHQLFTHFIPPKKGKKSVYVMVNGLVYSSDRWDGLVKELTKKGHGVLRYDFLNQAKTLGKQEKVVYRSLADHSDDLKGVISRHIKDDSEVHLVGLSYGASIATEFAKTHPKDLKSLTLMSPLVVSIEKYTPSGQMARSSLEMYKFWGSHAYEVAYENMYRGFIRNAYQVSRYPDVSVSRYQDALFELGKAARDFDLKQEIKAVKDVPVKLILAGAEDAPAKADILKVREILGSRGGEGFIEIDGASHAIPDNSAVEGAKALVSAGFFGK